LLHKNLKTKGITFILLFIVSKILIFIRQQRVVIVMKDNSSNSKLCFKIQLIFNCHF